MTADLDVEERALVAVRVRRVLVGAPLRPLHRSPELPRHQAEDDVLRVQADLVSEAAADVVRDEAELVDPRAERRRHPDRPDAGHLVVARERPLARALVVLDERSGALERRRREAVEVEPVDLHDVIRLGERGVDVAPVEDARPHDVRAGVVVEHDLVLQRLLGVDEHRERVVLDLDQLGGVARELAGRRADRRDRLAHVPHAADRERVVLDVPARLDGHLEERIRVDRDLVAGDRPVDAVELERLRDVDRDDLRVRRTASGRSGRSPSRDGARRRRTCPAPGRAAGPPCVGSTARRSPSRASCRRLGDSRHALPPAATTASTMFTYPVQRQMFPWIATRTSSSDGRGFRASSAVALISIPGVQ